MLGILVWAGSRYHAVAKLQSSGVWALALYPDQEEGPNIPEIVQEFVRLLHRAKLYQRDWYFVDGPRVAAIFEPIQAVSFLPTNEGLSKIAKSLRRIRTLESVTVSFGNGEQNINTESIEIFLRDIAAHPHLHTLSFREYPVQHLAALQGLEQLPHLKSIALSFDSGEDLTPNEPETSNHWLWLKQTPQLESMVISTQCEETIESITQMLPPDCALILNGYEIRGGLLAL